MMEASDAWKGDDIPQVRSLHGQRHRRVAVGRHVGTVLVEVVGLGPK